MDSIIQAVGWTLCGIWTVGMGLPLLVLWRRRISRLTRDLADPEHWPRLSVIITARNEGPRIRECLASLRASTYPNLEILAIDDRSEDQTGDVMVELAAEDPRIQVLRVTELPEDWLGKNHAMWTGSRAATGDLLLFTDGDVIYTPEALKTAVSFVVANRLDHLTLGPRMLSGSYLEEALVAFFGLLITTGTQSWLARWHTRHIYIGIGAFNLVSRTSYMAAGGHVPLRYEVADDMRLAQLLKRHGARADMLMAGNLLSVRWQDSAWSTITGLEKNGFAAAHFSIVRLLFGLSGAATLLYSPLVVLAASPGPSGRGFLAALICAHLGYAAAAATFGGRPWVAPMLLPASAAILFAFLRSMVITLRQGGICWRDTFYPLADLRNGLYR